MLQKNSRDGVGGKRCTAPAGRDCAQSAPTHGKATARRNTMNTAWVAYSACIREAYQRRPSSLQANHAQMLPKNGLIAFIDWLYCYTNKIKNLRIKRGLPPAFGLLLIAFNGFCSLPALAGTVPIQPKTRQVFAQPVCVVHHGALGACRLKQQAPRIR